MDQGCQADFLVTVDCELLENNFYLQHNLIYHFSWIEENENRHILNLSVDHF